MTVVSVTALFGSEDEARSVSRTIVEERYAACANIGGAIHSIYHWDGEIEEAGEVAVSFKTTAAVVDRLIARIAELHSYDVPCILSHPVDQVLASYAEWVEANCRV